MSSRCLRRKLWSPIAVILAMPAGAGVLRVCADPNNLPFSNRAGAGFENRIAALVASDLNANLEYVWAAARKSSVEHSLNEGQCDLMLGVPRDIPAALTTAPYYQSTYVFVSRKDRKLGVTSLNDAALEKLRIGIHITGDSYAPPAVVLARRGLSANLVGFTLLGKTGEANPPARLIEAVARGDVDLAIVWGPFAGYFAKSSKTPLEIAPVRPAAFAGVPFTFAMSAAVSTGNAPLRGEVQRALARECRAIAALLNEYAVPRVSEGESPCESSQPVSASLP